MTYTFVLPEAPNLASSWHCGTCGMGAYWTFERQTGIIDSLPASGAADPICINVQL